MSKEKQIEEMGAVLEKAKIEANATIGSMNNGFGTWYAQSLYNAGYRKQREGEWIYDYTSSHLEGTDAPLAYKCTLCNEYSTDPWNYCPFCGAKMKGE